MKSKLSAVLVAAGCVLAVSPANAISVTYNPMATTSSVPGAVLFDDFDSVQNTAIGTITGGVVKGPASGGPGTAPATGNFIYADGLLGSPLNVTVTFTNPVSYAGFAWGTPDLFNELDVYDGSTLLGSFIGNTSLSPPGDLAAHPTRDLAVRYLRDMSSLFGRTEPSELGPKLGRVNCIPSPPARAALQGIELQAISQRACWNFATSLVSAYAWRPPATHSVR